MPTVQPFSAVKVSVNDILADDLKLEIEALMFEYEQARVAETEAHNTVVLANAALLSARAARAISRTKLVAAFAKGSDKVAMEPNWAPFRDSDSRPAVENFLSERDQRNMFRMQRAQMNNEAAGIESAYGGMFEAPETD
jgi:hypothetical protein